MNTKTIIILAFSVLHFVDFVQGGTPDPKIRKKLLQNYDPMSQPYPSHYRTKTTVTIPYLNVIHYDVNDEAQTFELHAWIVMSWEDERLSWANYSTYDRSGYLHFDKEEIWLPDIATYNTAKPKAMDDFADNAQLLVQSNGTVIWVPPIRFITNCQMNLSNWPFDTQNCYVKIGSWTYHEDEIDLQFGPESAPQSRVRVMVHEGHRFPNNTQWQVTESSAVRTARKYSCCVEKYVDITYNFTLARKYSTFTYTLVLPAIMISAISVLGFLFPLTGSSRVTISTLNFLIITTYMIYFRTRLPTIDHVPKIVKLFTWNLFVTTVNLGMTAFLTNFTSARGNTKVPEWAKLILDSKIVNYISLAPTTEPVKRTVSSVKAKTYSRKGEGENSVEDGSTGTGSSYKDKKNDWSVLVDIVDKLSFLLFFFLSFIMVLAHLL